MRVLHGKMQLIFITPENIIENSMFRNMLLSMTFKEKLVPLVVDEVHCIKKWGDQFRKAFSVIGDLSSLIPININILTLVATATAETYRSILKRLWITDPVLVSLSPDRGSIMYTVCPTVNLMN